MKRGRLLLFIAVTALAAFATGWAFRAYLQPDAAVNLANRVFLCN